MLPLIARQAFWKLVQQSLESGCSFTDEEDAQCGGTRKVIPARKSRGAFIGCSDWKRGDPPTYLGGHMARWVPAGVDLDRLATWLDEGVEGLGEADTCTFTAPKRCRELVCKRHGGEFPSLVRSSGGRCPSRVEVYTPREKSGGGPVRVVVVMRGTHSHVVPVCKPRSSLVHSVVQENASEPIRTLQVRSLFYTGSCFLCILMLPFAGSSVVRAQNSRTNIFVYRSAEAVLLFFL